MLYRDLALFPLALALGAASLAAQGRGQCPATPRPTPPVRSAPTSPQGSVPGTGSPLASTPSTRGCGVPTPGSTPGTLLAEDTSWSVWWALNDDLLLDLRSHPGSGASTYGGSSFYLGKGERTTDPGTLPTRAEIEAEVLPVLRSTLKRDRSNIVQREALIALGRAGRALAPDVGETLVDDVLPYLQDPAQEVSEAAVLSLGILGHVKAISPLNAILSDSRAGREWTGGTEIPARMRAFAAYSLGLIGSTSENEDVRRHLVHHLSRAQDRDVSATRDTEVACLIAMAMMPLDDDGTSFEESGAQVASASRVGQIRLLRQLFESPFHDRLARAHAASSLGRLLEELPPQRRDELKRDVVPPLLKALGGEASETREVVQSVVLALGALLDWDADPQDEDIRSALMRLPRTEADRHTQNFALIALARGSVRPGSSPEKGARAETRSHLLARLARGDVEERPWAGLALGLQVHQSPKLSAAPADVALAVRTALAQATSPMETSGLCLALGLMRDTSSSDALGKLVRTSGSDLVRGYAALGLGLQGARDQGDEVQSALADSGRRPFLLEQLALSLALLESPQTLPRLIDHLADARSLDGRTAILSALGRVGDRRALAPLLATATRGSTVAQTRAQALAALGRVAEPTRFPWSAAFVPGANYGSPTETLFDLQQGRGVLNAR